jgi:hypothetical protein
MAIIPLLLGSSACTRYAVKTQIQEVKVKCVTEAWPDLVPVDLFYSCPISGKSLVCADPVKFTIHVSNDNKIVTWAKAAARACGILIPGETPTTKPVVKP